MCLVIVRIDQATYQRILGDELRRLRKQRGWTRRALQRELQSVVSLQTLATYELGTRQCTVVRFAELCFALGVLPHEVLARVHERVFHEPLGDSIRLDLRLILADNQHELLPLRRWARNRLLVGKDRSGEVRLDPAAVGRMAELCGLDTDELTARLQPFAV